MSADAITVLLCDDHPIVRAGARAVLASDPAIRVVAEAGSAQEALDAVRRAPVDVVLMDLQLGDPAAPGEVENSGVAATRALVALPQPPAVLVFTNYDSDADIVSAVEAGAAGYLLKDSPAEVLHDSVRRAAAGESALAPAITTRLLERVRRPAQALSARELDVLARAAAGDSNAQIAAGLFVTESTVKSHLASIYRKLGTASRTQAVAAARARGLLRDR